MTCRRFNTADYAFYAAGTLDGLDRDELREHLRAHCPSCLGELEEAHRFWFIFAALTEKTQMMSVREPSPLLREEIIGRVRLGKVAPKKVARAITWLRIAAGIVLAIGAGTLSWTAGRIELKREVAAAQKNATQERSAVIKLEAENTSLRNLVVAAKNAPPTFPGRDKIISVQDPYLLRDLQRARQADAAISQALNTERTKNSALEQRLSQTTVLLAAATRDKEDADQKVKKTSDAYVENQRGINQLSQQINDYKAKMHEREVELITSRTTLQSQATAVEQAAQIISILQSRNATMISLRSAEGGQTASGTAFIADNGRIAFVPANLPPSAPGRAYQLWMTDRNGGNPVGLATFVLAKDRQAVVFAKKPVASASFSFAMTEEPAGGAHKPTGIKLMTGSPKGF